MYTSTTKNNIDIIDYRTIEIKLHASYNQATVYHFNVENISYIEKSNNGTIIKIFGSFVTFEVSENYFDLLNTINYYKSQLQLPLL